MKGDPDHPVNLGGLCPKGAAMWGPSQHRDEGIAAPSFIRTACSIRWFAVGHKTWERLSWDQAALEIARHVKKTRDATFVEKEGDVTVIAATASPA